MGSQNTYLAKSLEKTFRTKLREFHCRWPTRKGLFAPHFHSGKDFSLMAITESYQENIYRLFFRVHFENDLYYYFCVLRCCSENLNRWLSLLPKKEHLVEFSLHNRVFLLDII